MELNIGTSATVLARHSAPSESAKPRLLADGRLPDNQRLHDHDCLSQTYFLPLSELLLDSDWRDSLPDYDLVFLLIIFAWLWQSFSADLCLILIGSQWKSISLQILVASTAPLLLDWRLGSDSSDPFEHRSLTCQPFPNQSNWKRDLN